jgi:hypothetical protein
MALSTSLYNPFKKAVDEEPDDLLPGLGEPAAQDTSSLQPQAVSTPLKVDDPGVTTVKPAVDEGQPTQQETTPQPTGSTPPPETIAATPVPPPPPPATALAPTAPQGPNDTGAGGVTYPGVGLTVPTEYGGDTGIVGDPYGGLLPGLTPTTGDPNAMQASGIDYGGTSGIINDSFGSLAPPATASDPSSQIAGWYNQYLGRAPEQGGLDSWLSSYGSAGPQAVEEGIRSSAEAQAYGARAGAQPAPDLLPSFPTAAVQPPAAPSAPNDAGTPSVPTSGAAVPSGATPAGWQYSGTGYVAPQRTAAPDPFTSTYTAPGAYQGAGAVPQTASMEDLLPGLAPYQGAGEAPNAASLSAIADSLPGYQGAGAAPTAERLQDLVSGLPSAQRGSGYTATPSEAGALSPKLEGYSDSWMANPNRYTTPLMEGRLEQIRNATARAREDSQGQLDAWAASRGLAGSSLEGEERNRLETGLNQNELASYNDLLDRIASVEAGDRAAAGSYGLGVGNFLQGQDAFNAGERRYGYDTSYRAGRDYEGDLLNRYTLGANARSADNASGLAAYDRAAQNARDAETGTLNRANLRIGATSADNANRFTRYGFDQDNAAAAEAARLNRTQIGLGARSADNSNLLARYGYTQQNARDAESGALNRANLGLSSDAAAYGRYADGRNFGLSSDQLNAQIEGERAGNELSRNSLDLGSDQFDLSRSDSLDNYDLEHLLQLYQMLGN